MGSLLMSRPVFIILLAIIQLLGISGCLSEQSTLEKIRERGFVRLGYSNDPPFAYQDEAGRLTGESIEVARKIFKRLGVPEVKGVLVKFDDLIEALYEDKFDIIAAGMFITSERAKKVDFAKPTYFLGQTFLVRRDNPKMLHSYRDLRKQSDAVLAIIEGAVQEGFAKEAGISEEQILPCYSTETAFEAVLDGKADALALSSIAVNALLERDDGKSVERADPFTPPRRDGRFVINYGAFALKKDDDELRQLINKELDDFISSQEHIQVVEPFGFTKCDIPNDVDAADIICE